MDDFLLGAKMAEVKSIYLFRLRSGRRGHTELLLMTESGKGKGNSHVPLSLNGTSTRGGNQRQKFTL